MICYTQSMVQLSFLARNKIKTIIIHLWSPVIQASFIVVSLSCRGGRSTFPTVGGILSIVEEKILN